MNADVKGRFREILDAADQNAASVLELEIEGNTYYRSFVPRERLLILGGGNIGQALCPFAAQLGFAVTAVDERPSFANAAVFPDAAEVVCDSFPKAIERFHVGANDYVVVVTRGHRWDTECLRCILPGCQPKYIGMIGSKRRVHGVLGILRSEGFDSDRISSIHTPIGLDIGALTTKEIAISILAELISCRRKDLRRSSKSQVLINDDIDMQLLKFITDSSTRKALLLVYETAGSTPVQSGAYMAIDEMNQICGTIGGGCSEGEVLRKAFRLIGSGQEETAFVDMSNDIAEEEGMVCGGSMKVWIRDIGCP